MFKSGQLTKNWYFYCVHPTTKQAENQFDWNIGKHVSKTVWILFLSKWLQSVIDKFEKPNPDLVKLV